MKRPGHEEWRFGADGRASPDTTSPRPLDGRGLGLITPHGDRERGAGPTSSLRYSSHYPSWGSGTGVGKLDPGYQHEISLPLMGIGNNSRWAGASAPAGSSHYPSWGSGTRSPAFTPRWNSTHYPSWGSGTMLAGLGSEGTSKLITPHGDREPRKQTTQAGVPEAHYPSWGSGTATYL